MRAIFRTHWMVTCMLALGACAVDHMPLDDRSADNTPTDKALRGDDSTPSNPATQADDPPAGVTIRGLSWAGSGCPAGTVAWNVAPDAMAFTLLFDSYVAEMGPGVPLGNSRRNCQILVDLDFPQGWSYSVATVDYRGFSNLESGVTGVQQSNYYFQGELLTGRLQTPLQGPRIGDFQIRDVLGLEALIWSPCGAQRALNINSSVRVENHSGNPNARGVLTTDSIDGKVALIYGLQWRRCPI
jgi:Domain of unknown function (DUF4360)